jgi:hypothetical protein
MAVKNKTGRNTFRKSDPDKLRPYIRILGKWFPIKESEIPQYEGFKIEYR